MEKLTAESGLRSSVDRIADDREIDRRQMDANLVRPPRLEPDTQERVAWQHALDLEVRDGTPRRVRIERHAHRVIAVTADRCLDPPATRRGTASDEGEIGALEVVRANKLGKLTMCLVGSGDHHQPGGVAVEAVDDPRALGVAAGEHAGKSVNERPRRPTGAGVNDEASRLVDNGEVLVLPDDPRRDGDRVGALTRVSVRNWKPQALPTLEAVALRSRETVDEHAGLDCALGGGA